MATDWPFSFLLSSAFLFASPLLFFRYVWCFPQADCFSCSVMVFLRVYAASSGVSAVSTAASIFFPSDSFYPT